MKRIVSKKAFWGILVAIAVVGTVMLATSRDVGGEVPDWIIWAMFVPVVFVGCCIVIAIRESITNRGPFNSTVKKK